MDVLPCLGLSVLALGFLGLARVGHFLLLVAASTEMSSELSYLQSPNEDEPLFPLAPKGSFLHLCECAFTSSLPVLKSLQWPCSHLRLG